MFRCQQNWLNQMSKFICANDMQRSNVSWENKRLCNVIKIRFHNGISMLLEYYVNVDEIYVIISKMSASNQCVISTERFIKSEVNLFQRSLMEIQLIEMYFPNIPFVTCYTTITTNYCPHVNLEPDMGINVNIQT